MPEDPNPYQAPRSDAEQFPSSGSGRTGWKVYACGVGVIQIVGLFFALPKSGITEGLDYAVTAVGMLGLFGYAFRRRCLRRRIWTFWCVFFPLWDGVMGAWVYPKQTGTDFQKGYFLAMLLFLPQYLALIRYAFSSGELWTQSRQL